MTAEGWELAKVVAVAMVAEEAAMVMAAEVAAAVVVMKEAAVMVASGKRTEIENQARRNHESYSRSHCMRQRTAHERCGSLSRRMNVGLGNRQDLGGCVGK